MAQLAWRIRAQLSILLLVEDVDEVGATFTTLSIFLGNSDSSSGASDSKVALLTLESPAFL